jgi:hypothetical protein
VSFYAVDPNDDAKYSDETLANMKARADEKDYPFPYLKDGDSSTARAYGTPALRRTSTSSTAKESSATAAMSTTPRNRPSARPPA